MNISTLEIYTKNYYVFCTILSKFILLCFIIFACIFKRHFYDSLTIVKNIDLTKIANLLDIGTGAGFPGMVLKIVFPSLKVTLLDSNNKKIAFLKELAKKLNLNVEIVYDRAEIFVQNRREFYDIVTSRAVADLSILSELAIPYLKVGGNFIAMKANYQDELHNAENIIKKLHSKVTKITEFTLPATDMIRGIITINKEKITNKKYPRSYNTIKKDAQIKLQKQQ